MTQNKKAELQRKLSMAPVARPPGDLLDRLKNDIPSDLLNAQRDRERMSRSTAFSLRVAAAIILMIGSTFALVQFLSREDTRGKSPQASFAVRRADAPARADSKIAEVTTTTATEAKSESNQVKEKATSVAPARPIEVAQSHGVEGGVVGGVVGGAVGGIVANEAVMEAVAAAPPPPPPAAPVAPTIADLSSNAAAPAPQVYPAASLTRQARDEKRLSVGAARGVFGISVDAGEFARLRTLIERGQAPEAGKVNVDALVNHFAGSLPARRDVRLEVEASRAPLAGEAMMLRYTIDTAPASQRGSLPLVGTNARLDIEINDKTVADYKLLADGATMHATEPRLLTNLSATGLIELYLRPDVKPRERLATVRLRYHSISSGREETLEGRIDASHAQRPWIAASHRHRLATLGAVWGESLKGKVTTAPDVARRAEELATESPSDNRAQDLAKAATASSRLRSF